MGVPLAPAPTGALPPDAESGLSGAEAAPAPTATPDRGPRSGRWVIEWLVVIIAAVLLAFGVRTYVAQMFYIPSGSMLPTLQVGDRIVVDKLSYQFGTVQRGDIVVFARPPLVDADYTDLVKRVIGLPGETIARDGQVTINGKILNEPWLPHPEPLSEPSSLSEPFSLTHPYTIPADHYFVMGDNRTDSEDSRYFGPIPGSSSWARWRSGVAARRDRLADSARRDRRDRPRRGVDDASAGRRAGPIDDGPAGSARP